jgi:hypothetical protein
LAAGCKQQFSFGAGGLLMDFMMRGLEIGPYTPEEA